MGNQRRDGRTLTPVPLSEEEKKIVERAIKAKAERIKRSSGLIMAPEIPLTVFMRDAALEVARIELEREKMTGSR